MRSLKSEILRLQKQNRRGSSVSRSSSSSDMEFFDSVWSPGSSPEASPRVPTPPHGAQVPSSTSQESDRKVDQQPQNASSESDASNLASVFRPTSLGSPSSNTFQSIDSPASVSPSPSPDVGRPTSGQSNGGSRGSGRSAAPRRIIALPTRRRPCFPSEQAPTVGADSKDEAGPSDRSEPAASSAPPGLTLTSFGAPGSMSRRLATVADFRSLNDAFLHPSEGASSSSNSHFAEKAARLSAVEPRVPSAVREDSESSTDEQADRLGRSLEPMDDNATVNPTDGSSFAARNGAHSNGPSVPLPLPQPSTSQARRMVGPSRTRRPRTRGPSPRSTSARSPSLSPSDFFRPAAGLPGAPVIHPGWPMFPARNQLVPISTAQYREELARLRDSSGGFAGYASLSNGFAQTAANAEPLATSFHHSESPAH